MSTDLNVELEQQIATYAELVATLESKLADASQSRDQVDQQLQASQQLVTEIQSELQELSASRGTDQPDASTLQELDDLRSRYELAMEDVRELKRRNEQLEASAGSIAPTEQSDVSSWEAQKSRLLASLADEADEYGMDDSRREEHVTIEGTIRITDDIVSRKDAEIAELHAKLQQADEQRAVPSSRA